MNSMGLLTSNCTSTLSTLPPLTIFFFFTFKPDSYLRRILCLRLTRTAQARSPCLGASCTRCCADTRSTRSCAPSSCRLLPLWHNDKDQSNTLDSRSSPSSTHSPSTSSPIPAFANSRLSLAGNTVCLRPRFRCLCRRSVGHHRSFWLTGLLWVSSILSFMLISHISRLPSIVYSAVLSPSIRAPRVVRARTARVFHLSKSCHVHFA
jgi:hypothetical protein